MKKTFSIKLKYIIYIIIILLILGLLISIPKKIIYENDVINIFHNNEIMFANVTNKLNDTEIVVVDKEFLIYRLTIDNFKNYKYIFDYKNEKYNKYREIFDVMNKLNVQSVSKYDNNTEFWFDSIVRPGMLIAYINDMEQYKKDHSIIKIKKLKQYWYYVEVD